MINWSDIDTILLDMDGTLLDLHFDNFFWLQHLPKRYAETHGLPPGEARANLHAKIEQLQGDLNWYCLDYWSNELALDIPALKEEVAHLIQFRPHVDPFLRQLQQSGKQVILATNAHRKSLSLKLAHTRLGDYLDTFVSSHDYGYAKEQQGFWQALQQQYPFHPEHTLLIDDSLPVLKSARDFGIRHLLTILVPDSKKPARQLTEDHDFLAISHLDELAPVHPSNSGL